MVVNFPKFFKCDRALADVYSPWELGEEFSIRPNSRGTG
ncbi:hypothetical protein B711_0258 [Chlamydia psittaci CP3]|nr:hypothetical protein B711_0258 [Chlamydia psittaci CP3]